MNLKEAKRFAEPYLYNGGTVTVTHDRGSLAVYIGETVKFMEALCKERGWDLFVIRDCDKTSKVIEAKLDEVTTLEVTDDEATKKKTKKK